MKITKAEAQLLAGALAKKWVEVRTLMQLPGVEDPQAQRIGKQAQKILDRLNEVRKFAGLPIKGGAIR